MFFGGKSPKIALFSLSLSFFPGKIRNEKIRFHVIPHDPFWAIPQKIQSRKDPSFEACKFTGVENFVPISFRDSLLRVRPAVQVHDYNFW